MITNDILNKTDYNSDRVNNALQYMITCVTYVDTFKCVRPQDNYDLHRKITLRNAAAHYEKNAVP